MEQNLGPHMEQNGLPWLHLQAKFHRGILLLYPIQRKVELVFPTEFESGLTQYIIPILRSPDVLLQDLQHELQVYR